MPADVSSAPVEVNVSLVQGVSVKVDKSVCSGIMEGVVFCHSKM